MDRVGNVYVTGRSYGTGTYADFDYATVKYSADGKQLWTQRYTRPSLGDDVPNAIALDSVGNVYITGESRNGFRFESGTPNAFPDYLTLKYKTTGN